MGHGRDHPLDCGGAGQAHPSDPAAAASGRDPWGAVVSWVDRRGGAGPLAGLRLGVKDLIAVAGVPRLCGAPGLADPAPQPRDAGAVARLVAAGAVVVATTATHQYAYGIVTPQTRNPRAVDRIAGGSSGGSAAALAAGIVDAALGSDTGGSIRIPSACCGVVGLKPTFGRVPVDGVQALAPSLDTVGPMARDVATVTRLLGPLLAAEVTPTLPQPLRVGVPRQVRSARLDPEVRAAWEAMLGGLERTGRAAVRDVDLPSLEDAHTANGRLLAWEAAATHAAALAATPEAFNPDVRQRLLRAGELTSAELAAARATRDRLRAELAEAFAEVSVLLTPTLPCRVPGVGVDPVVVDGVAERRTSLLTRGTNSWNLAGVPAGSVPAGKDGGGAPIGMQVAGAWGDEATVLAVMALLEALAGGPWPPVRRQ